MIPAAFDYLAPGSLADAMAVLGDFHRMGLGVPVDLEAARIWQARAVAAGSPVIRFFRTLFRWVTRARR